MFKLFRIQNIDACVQGKAEVIDLMIINRLQISVHVQ